MNMDIFNRKFPSDASDDDEAPTDRWCVSFSEAASTFPGDRLPSGDTTEFLKGFFDGIKEDSMPWYTYDDPEHLFEISFKFQFEDANADETSKKIFKAILIRHVLLAHLFMAKTHQSFEYYHPTTTAH